MPTLSTLRGIAYGAGFIALIAIAFGLYRWSFDRGVASVQPKLVAAQAATQVAASANASNQTTIDDLESKNAECVSEVAARTAVAQNAETVLAQTQAKANASAKAAAAARQKIYATNPGAEAWGRVLVPAALTGSLIVDPDK